MAAGNEAEAGAVCVIHTGGTIGTRHMDRELHPGDSSMLRVEEVESLLRHRSGLSVKYEFRPLLGQEDFGFKPIVSSQIRPAHWTLIAKTIERYYKHYVGFVVLHGTDTMAWTASALSFMLANLSKPVVLTGSQRPISADSSDAVHNFANAVMLAGRGHESIPLIPEVVICFGDRVLRGNRCTKSSAASMQGFDTPNCPAVGRVGRQFDIDVQQVRPAPPHLDGFYVNSAFESQVADVVLYPGIPADQLKFVLDASKGAVVRTFGAGNTTGGEVEHVVEEAVKQGRVVVYVTQCAEGTVEAGMLSGSVALSSDGVVSGLDLTPEAALTKLMFLLGNHPPGVVREQMQLDLRGEQSIDLITLDASSGEGDGGHAELTSSLHARVRPDRILSAVLRLQVTCEPTQPAPSRVTLGLNDREGTNRPEEDPRALGEQALRGAPNSNQATIVQDVTEAVRRVVRAGESVTLTAVPDAGSISYRVALSLFMSREPTDAG